MAERDAPEIALQCLRDCGCPPQMMERFRRCAQENRVCDQIRLLESHRAHLMDDLHSAQKKVDCIDFLLRELRGDGRERQ